jgi:hypothetical protein
MKKTITTLVVTVVTSICANAQPPAPVQEWNVRHMSPQDRTRNTQDLRIEHAQRRQREAEVMNDEFANICEYVRAKVAAKYGGPEQALQHPEDIKSECRYQMFQFASKYRINDTLTWAYKMQELVTASLKEQKSSPEIAKF